MAEFNAHIDVITAVQIPDNARKILNRAQHQLFDIGAEFCVPGWNKVGDDYVSKLDAALENCYVPLPAQREFILPGGGPATALVTRTVFNIGAVWIGFRYSYANRTDTLVHSINAFVADMLLNQPCLSG